MKTRYIIVLLVGLFVVTLFVDRNSSRLNSDLMRWAAAMDWTVSALGAGIAVISAFRILHAAFQGAKLPQILPITVSLFAGLMLFQRFWSIHLAFASILVCWLIVEHLRPPEKKSGD